VATFRYHFYDWASGAKLDTLPVEQVTCTWEVNSAGTFTGVIDLRGDSTPAGRVIPATEPLRTKVFLERDSTLIWGGQVTEPRSYDSGTGKLTVNGQETVGYLASRFVPTLSLYGADQITIAEQVIASLQAVAGGDANLQVAAPDGLSGVLRDGVYSQYDFTNGLQALTDLTGMDDGFEFATQVQWAGGMPLETLVLAYPRLGRIGSASPAVIEHNFGTSGNCQTYTWPDGPGLFTRTWADATTADGVQLDASCNNTDLVNAGYPLLEQKVDASSSKPTTLAVLQAIANKQGRWADGERVAAQFNVNATAGMEIGDWLAGDDVMVRITDFRFPAGPQGQPGFADYMRIGQAQLTTDDNGLEVYQLTTLDYTESV
jgi:hypothetical protein